MYIGQTRPVAAVEPITVANLGFPYAGKNLLINSDKAISQRGDYSTATAIVNGYYVDRCNASISIITGTIQHKAYDLSVEARPILYTVTSSATGFIVHNQKVEDYEKLRGKTVTYTAWIKSNIPVNLYISDGVNVTYSSKHTGGGNYELLSVVVTIDSAATKLDVVVSNYDGATTALLTNDYFEVGNEQVELGEEATDFEYVSPTDQLARCQRYYFKSSLDLTARGRNAYGRATLFFPTTMRAIPVLDGTISSSGATSPVLVATTSGALSQALFDDLGSANHYGYGAGWTADAEL